MMDRTEEESPCKSHDTQMPLPISKSWKRNMAIRRTRQSGRDAVNRKSKTFSGKRNTPSWQRRRCGKWRDEEYGDTTPFENAGLSV